MGFLLNELRRQKASSQGDVSGHCVSALGRSGHADRMVTWQVAFKLNSGRGVNRSTERYHADAG
jgi:hypothetical protein